MPCSVRVLLGIVASIVLASCGGTESTSPTSVPPISTIVRPPGYDSAWCVSARDIEATSTAMDVVDPTDPAAVETAVTEMLAAAESAAPLAPAEIADDVDAALASFREIAAALAEVEYDLLRADLAGIADDPGPSERVDAYNVEVCGLSPVVRGGSSGGLDPAAGPLRGQLVDTLVASGFTVDEANCVLDNVDVLDVTQWQDEQVLADVVSTCGIDLERLAASAGGA